MLSRSVWLFLVILFVEVLSGFSFNWRLKRSLSGTKVKRQAPTYQLFTEKKLSYYDAKEDCQKRGGNLACVKTEEVNKQLIDMLSKAPDPNVNAWLGMESQGNDGYFVCLDGSHKIFFSKNETEREGYQPWIPWNPEDYPNGFVCVNMLPKKFGEHFGTWADENLSTCKRAEGAYYFCEFQK